MKELKDYVARKNAFAKIWDEKELDLNDPTDRQLIAQELDCDLSPENLSCDGELPRSQVQARYRALSRAAGQLLKLDPSVTIYEYSE